MTDMGTNAFKAGRWLPGGKDSCQEHLLVEKHDLPLDPPSSGCPWRAHIFWTKDYGLFMSLVDIWPLVVCMGKGMGRGFKT